MSLGVVVLRGNCPRGSCPMGVILIQGSCPQGKCPQGSCTRGSCPGGSCPRTISYKSLLLAKIRKYITQEVAIRIYKTYIYDFACA